MSSPALALQGAINTRLRSQVAAVSSRVYDAVPQTVEFPYISFGEFQTVEDGAGCIAADEVFVTLHVWTRPVGTVQAHQICDAITVALHEWTPDLSASSLDCIELMHRDTRVMRDPDGLTTHGILTFRALVDRL